MLVFGPFHAGPGVDQGFRMFNLSSPTEYIPKLPGLFVLPPDKKFYPSIEVAEQAEKTFDTWYYNYVLNDPQASMSLMMVLDALYEGNKVYVCIESYDGSRNDYISTLNESFMKIIQTRYDIKYSIINTRDDLNYIPQDGCDFMSVAGIQQFDEDKKRWMMLNVESQIINNSLPTNDDY